MEYLPMLTTKLVFLREKYCASLVVETYSTAFVEDGTIICYKECIQEKPTIRLLQQLYVGIFVLYQQQKSAVDKLSIFCHFFDLLLENNTFAKATGLDFLYAMILCNLDNLLQRLVNDSYIIKNRAFTNLVPDMSCLKSKRIYDRKRIKHRYGLLKPKQESKQ